MDTTSSQTSIAHESFQRYPGEHVALALAIVVLLAVTFGVLSFSLPLALVLLVAGIAYVKVRQSQLLGNSVLVTPTSFKEVNAIIAEACSRIALQRPRVHIVQDPVINAFAIGYSSPFSVVLHSSAVQYLDTTEMLFVLGHEMGHVKAGHTRWLSVLAPLGTNTPGWFGVVFGFWQRRAEYTADRGGLIACRDLNAAVRALLKLSSGPNAVENVDIQGVLQQGQQDDPLRDIGEILGTHPYMTNRIQRLVTFDREVLGKAATRHAQPETPSSATHDQRNGSQSAETREEICEWRSAPMQKQVSEPHSGATPQEAIGREAARIPDGSLSPVLSLAGVALILVVMATALGTWGYIAARASQADSTTWEEEGAAIAVRACNAALVRSPYVISPGVIARGSYHHPIARIQYTNAIYQDEAGSRRTGTLVCTVDMTTATDRVDVEHVKLTHE